MAVVACYLLDTSVLARMNQAAVSARVSPLITGGLVATCPVIEMEVLYSARSRDDYEAIRADRALAYEYLPVNDEDWQWALEVQRELAARGRLRAVGIPDLLIAATAERQKVEILHYDADFDHIVDITGQASSWVVPRGSIS